MNIYKNDEARQNVQDGAEVLYDAVKTTLGPKGRNVLIRDKFGGFTVTHDGVTVAKAINLRDDPRSVGVEIIREASKKMDQIGDGTTSVTVLTYHLILEANKLIAGGANPMMVKRELEACIPGLIEQIKSNSKKIEKNYDDVLAVATVSVGSETLGKLVADLMTKVGYDGAISVETTQALEDETRVVEGFSFDRGYMSPYFITDQGSRQAVLKNPAVILVNSVMSDLQEYENIFNVLVEQNIRNVLIVAENIEAEALGTLILNKVKGSLNVVAVKAPSYSAKRQEAFKDIAAVTGATIIDPSVGDWKNALGFNTLGAAEKVIVGFDETIIMGGQGDVEDRVSKLKQSLKTVKNDEKDEINERIARLKGNVGIIKVGGATETEAEEKKYRFDDAVGAVKSAMKGGIVAGGGVTLRDLSVNYLFKDSPVSDLLGAALCKPYDVLLENSGYDPTEKFVQGQGINVITGEKVDTLKTGIVDPTEVTCEVVRNAITTACIAITVGGAIVDKQLSQEEMTQLMSHAG